MTNCMKKIIQASLLAMLLFLPVSLVEAANEPTNVVGFNYKVEYPKNQLGKNKGYFDLLMEPGQEQTANIILSNPGKEKVVVGVSVNGTKTNSNGVIEYGPTKLENDDSLKFPFEEVVSAPETIELEAGEVVTLPLTVKMPETSFDGMILGGIQLKKAEQGADTENDGGATVRNEYSYVVAMVLKIKKDAVLPDIKMNQAFAGQENYRNTIGINFSNTTASLTSGKMSVESQVMKKGSEEVLYERKQTGMSIAPNTKMSFPVPMNGEAMIPGEYTADILVTINDKKWQDSLDFTVTKEDADKYNKRDVGLVQDRGLDWKVVALIVGGVLVVVVVVFVIIKVSQRSRAQNMSPKSSSKKRSRKKKKK